MCRRCEYRLRAESEWQRTAERHRSGAEQAAWCSGRVVARAAAVGNAVAARQVIVIGAAVPLSPRPSRSARTRTLALVCVLLAHRSFFSRSRRRLTPRRRRRSRFLRCGGWRPPQGRPAAVGAIRGGGTDAVLSFLKLFLFLFSCFLCQLVRSGLFYLILYLYTVIINSDDAHNERVFRSIDLIIALHLNKGNHDICNFLYIFCKIVSFIIYYLI